MFENVIASSFLSFLNVVSTRLPTRFWHIKLGGGQAVSVFASYSIKPGSNPTEFYNFYSVQIVWKTNTIKEARNSFAQWIEPKVAPMTAAFTTII